MKKKGVKTMREITYNNIVSAVAELCEKAAVWLPADVAMAIECASEQEENEAGKAALCDLYDNFQYAASADMPICQYTGMAVVFADIGQDVHITDGYFEDAINDGVRLGYEKGYLRKSVVGDPLRRVNTNDNTPAVIHTRIVPGDKLHIMVAPKGFGSENMSAMRMFVPANTREDIISFIAETVKTAGARPCPPVIVGVGIGGTIEKAAYLAKKALTRPIDTRNPDEYYAQMETDCLEEINKLGIGAQGFGGKYTALAVNIETFATHIAGLPCVVNMGCHATRHAEITL